MTNHTKYNLKYWVVHLADFLDHEFQALSGFINLGNTLAHKVKHEALSQFNFETYVLVNEPTNRSVQFHCLEDEPTTDRFNLMAWEMNLQTDQFDLID
jgi:hypothetical protein